MANSVEMKLTGDLDGALARFEQKVKDSILFSGVAAAANVIYEEMQTNVQSLGIKTGKLRASIFRAYSAKSSSDDQKTYRISWNYKIAPHGHLVEFGYWQKYQVIKLEDGAWITLKNRPLASPRWIPPQPFVRPAFDHIDRALSAGKARMAQRLAGAQ